MRQFRFETGEVLPFVMASRQLGQDLFAPPNVKGWPGGEAWINSATLLQRKQLLERLFRAQEMRPTLVAMTRDGGDNAQVPGKAGAEVRQRVLRAMMDIHFDGDKWLSQFRPGDAQLVKVVLAADPVNAPPADAQGVELAAATGARPRVSVEISARHARRWSSYGPT